MLPTDIRNISFMIEPYYADVYRTVKRFFADAPPAMSQGTALLRQMGFTIREDSLKQASLRLSADNVSH